MNEYMAEYGPELVEEYERLVTGVLADAEIPEVRAQALEAWCVVQSLDSRGLALTNRLNEEPRGERADPLVYEVAATQARLRAFRQDAGLEALDPGLQDLLAVVQALLNGWESDLPWNLAAEGVLLAVSDVARSREASNPAFQDAIETVAELRQYIRELYHEIPESFLRNTLHDIIGILGWVE